MKKILILLLITAPLHSYAQKVVAKTSKVKFFSDAAIEDITATTDKAMGIIDLSKGEFAFSISIKDFEFEKSLMKEHFNEKYMETEKYPKATFTGKIENFDAAAVTQEVKAVGKMTVHGVTRDVEIPATIRKTDSSYKVEAKYMVKLEDYHIKIPQLLFQNVAEAVEVTVDFSFAPQ